MRSFTAARRRERWGNISWETFKVLAWTLAMCSVSIPLATVGDDLHDTVAQVTAIAP